MNTKLGAFIIFFFAIYAICVTVRMFRKDRLSIRLFLMWLFICLAIGFLALFPSALVSLMKLANMGSWTFFITTGAIFVLFIIIFYVTSNLSRMDRKISKLVQETAILEYKLKNQSKGNKNI